MYRPYFMMKSIGEDYYLECRGPGFRLDDRELETDDIERFETWISAYRRALPKNDPAEEMLSLGREIFGWLDRDDNWFSALKANRKVEGWGRCFVVAL